MANNPQTTFERPDNDHDRVAELRYVLEACRIRFQFYADEHTKANKTEKAATNQAMANSCKKCLERTS